MAPTLTLASSYPFVKRSGPYCDPYACYAIPLPALIAIVVGGIALIAGLIALYFVVRCMRRRRALRKDEYTQQILALPSEPIAFNPHAFSGWFVFCAHLSPFGKLYTNEHLDLVDRSISYIARAMLAHRVWGEFEHGLAPTQDELSAIDS